MPSQFAETLQYFLADGNQEHWTNIQNLARENNDDSDKIIRKYVLEAQRLTSAQRNLRIVAEATTIDGQAFKKGDSVVCLLVRSQSVPLCSCKAALVLTS